MKKFSLAIFHVIFICLAINTHSQSYDPLSLQFTKEYQVRNFYNSSVLLSQIDLSQDVLNESIHPRLDLTSPGCELEQNGRVLQFSNSSGTDQESYINLGPLYNYAAIDVDIHWYGAEEFAKDFFEYQKPSQCQPQH